MRVDSFTVAGIHQWAAHHDAYRARSAVPTALPRLECLEPTNDCNLRCIMCPRTGARPVGYLDVAFLRRLVERERDWLQGQHVWLHFHGEPLLHPKLLDIIELVRDAGVYPRLSTNCILLTPELSLALLRSGLTLVVFSVDGWDAATLGTIRPGADYRDIVDKIHRFIDLRRQLGACEPAIQVQFLDTGLTHHGLERVKGLWTDAGVDMINIRRVSSRAGQVQGWKRLRLPADRASRDAGNRPPCWWLWHAAVVLFDGRVVPCCCDLEGTMVMGHLSLHAIADIWQGPAYSRLRARHARGDFEGLCRTCSDWLGYHPEDWDKLLELREGRGLEAGYLTDSHRFIAVGR